MGETAPHNGSCGVVVPLQILSCSEIERKHKCKGNGKNAGIIFSFSCELEAKTRANRVEGGGTRGQSLAALFGAAREGHVHRLL